MIHHVRGLFPALLFRFISMYDCEGWRSWRKQPALPSADRLLAAEWWTVKLSRHLFPGCAHVPLISWWETLTNWLRHREEESAEWAERVIQKRHPQKAPIRAGSVAYLGWDGKMGTQTQTDEDQWWEIQQSMGGEWGRLEGYEQMEEWQNGTSVWWGEIWRKEGWKGEMWGTVMDEWLYQAVYPDYSSEFSAIRPPWKHFCEFVPLDEEWIMQ